jgi:peptide/nickel transport system substrate-binding protein
MFDSYDGSTVTLRRNPYFKGDQSGNMPAFEWIIQTVVPDGEGMAVSMLLDGDIDFISHDTAGDYSEMAMNSPLSNFSVANRYYRDGFGAISFVCDWGATADPNVRWAIACMIDRSAVIDQLFDGYGATVDAPYSPAQWAYLQRSSELATRLSPIAADLDRANDFLDRTEWVFEADGATRFDRARASADGSYLRHNSSGEALVIHHLSASARVGGAIERETSANGPLIGMSFEVTYGDSNTLLDNYYYGFNMGDARYYNSFNIAISITAVNDMYWSSYHSDMLGTWLNSTQYASPELDAVISQMRRLDPSETGRHADLWVESQALLQQGLPVFPLYSNEYFDFFNSIVKSVPTTPYNSYEEVICQIEKW